MFYDRLKSLCDERGIAISKVVYQLGFSSGNLARWKSGIVPRSDTLKKIADYFGVTTDYLLGNEKTPTTDESDERDKELMEYLDYLRSRPECRALMRTVRGATKEEVERNVAVLEALRKHNVD